VLFRSRPDEIRAAVQKAVSLFPAAAREIAEIANVSLENGLPYVGLSAFAHKAGMHADGVLKSRRSFEHIPPESVGNERRFLMSEVAGRSAVLNKLREFLPALDKDGGEAATVLKRLKELELSGYQFESADASFMLMAYKALGLFEPSFKLISFKVITETPAVEGVSATATIKIRVGGKTEFASGEGDGPVNALDKALRKALLVFYPRLSAVSLTDYKVRVLDTSAATAANVRVLITSTDGKEIWTTIGVSTDIIKASWLALSDSVEYKLMRKEKGK
jgi:2-isopropylmalate synthase